jgi:hypothetical protein
MQQLEIVIYIDATKKSPTVRLPFTSPTCCQASKSSTLPHIHFQSFIHSVDTDILSNNYVIIFTIKRSGVVDIGLVSLNGITFFPTIREIIRVAPVQ